MLKELYAQYGELYVKLEIINNKLKEVKQKIIQELNEGSISNKKEEDNGGAE